MPAEERSDSYRDYWDRNISSWSEMYLDISHGHETLRGPRWFSWVYNHSIGRIEQRLMADRYRRTIALLDRYARPGITLNDLGCGNGIFVVQALKRGAAVNAVDFSRVALDIARNAVTKHCGSDAPVKYLQADAQRDPLPESDVTLAMGLTPYIADMPAFMANVLPRTKVLCCLYVDPRHWANRIRSKIPALNVRRLRYNASVEIDALYGLHGWRLVERKTFGTGYIDVATGEPPG